MAWPKGKPRKPQGESVQSADAPVSAPVKKRPLLKSRPNWDDYGDGPDDGEDRLHIPEHMMYPGYDFMWVTDSVYGQPMPRERARYEKGGWTPVHHGDFDGVFDGRFMAKDLEGEIQVDGLVLMTRPLELSIKSRRRDAAKAAAQVNTKQQQLTGGDLPGVTLDSRHKSATSSNRINRTIEPIAIPTDAE